VFSLSSEIKERLAALYGDSFPSMATVKNWFNEFQRGRTSVFDEPRPGAPKAATTEDNVNKIHNSCIGRPPIGDTRNS